MYKAEYEDGEYEIIFADSGEDALREAFGMADGHGILEGLEEIDNEYNTVEIIF